MQCEAALFVEETGRLRFVASHNVLANQPLSIDQSSMRGKAIFRKCVLGRVSG